MEGSYHKVCFCFEFKLVFWERKAVHFVIGDIFLSLILFVSIELYVVRIVAIYS